jgi:hypothetical protein
MKSIDIPFWHRIGCSVREAEVATGVGRTKLFELIAEGRIKSTLVGARRVISVASLRQLIDGEASLSAA